MSFANFWTGFYFFVNELQEFLSILDSYYISIYTCYLEHSFIIYHIYTYAHTLISISVYWKTWIHTDASNSSPIAEFIFFPWASIFYHPSLAPIFLIISIWQVPLYVTNLPSLPGSPDQSPLFGLWVPILSHPWAVLLPSNTHEYPLHPARGVLISRHVSSPSWTSSSGFGSASWLWVMPPTWHPPHNTWAWRPSHWAPVALYSHPLPQGRCLPRATLLLAVWLDR